MNNENTQKISLWLQIIASVCGIVAFTWEYQRRQAEKVKS